MEVDELGAQGFTDEDARYREQGLRKCGTQSSPILIKKYGGAPANRRCRSTK
jgi:hypothetical protein